MSAFSLVLNTSGAPITPEQLANGTRAFQDRANAPVLIQPRPDLAVFLFADAAFELPVPVEQHEGRGAAFLVPSGPGSQPDLVSSRPGLSALSASALSNDPELDGRLRFPFLSIAWTEGSVRLLTDPLGFRAAFYSQQGDLFLAGSEPKLILAHPEVPDDPNLGILAERLSFRLNTPYQSIYDALRLVPAGSSLTVQAQGRLAIRPWYEWDVTVNHDRPLGEWQEIIRGTFLDIMREELETRDPSTIMLSLSGGLDSSVIAGVVRHLGFDDRVQIIGRRYPGLPCDESEYQDAVTAGTRFATKYVDHRPLDPIVDVVEPIHAGRVPYRMFEPEADDLLRWGTEQGRRVLMDGIGGDESFSRYGGILADVVADRRWSDLQSAIRGRSWRQLGREHFAMVPRGLRAQRRARSGIPIVSDSLSDRVGLPQRFEFPQRGAGSASLAQNRLQDNTATGWQALSSESVESRLALRRVEGCTPFYDPRLLGLMLTVPDHILASPDDQRFLQRTTFESFLPAEIVQRRSKVHFDYRHGTDLLHPWIEDRFSSMQLEREGLIDGDELRRLHADLKQGMETDFPNMPSHSGRLWMALALEIWWSHSYPTPAL